ncbi:MAG: hypothetical protein RRZ93_06615 [Ruthenibacterium sp.]
MNVWKQRLILLLGVLCTELACNLALLPRSVWTLFLCLTVLVLLVRVRPKMPTKPMKVLRAG